MPPPHAACGGPSGGVCALGATTKDEFGCDSHRGREGAISECMRKKDCEWEVIRLHARGEYLGVVSAPDENAALKAAVKIFEIKDAEQQKRLLVRQA